MKWVILRRKGKEGKGEEVRRRGLGKGGERCVEKGRECIDREDKERKEGHVGGK